VYSRKLAFLLLKIAGGLGLYALVARYLAAPAAGIVAGYALAFGAIANYQIEHLDGVLAVAMMPPLVMAAIELLRRRGLVAIAALGGLAAAEFVNNWVHALSVPVAVMALAAFRPGLGAEVNPWRDRRLASVWAGRIAAALGVFAVLAGSQIIWIAMDSGNHRLASVLTPAERDVFIERSPFLFVNRDNVLGPWLAAHHPPGLDVADMDGGRRYLGGVCLAVCAIGIAAMRASKRSDLLRWAAFSGTVIWVEYWLSLGPRTLLWEIGTSLHWTPAAQAGVRGGLLAVSLLCLGIGVIRARGSSARGRWAAIGRALAASLLLAFPAVSLWSTCARLFPVLEFQRSPGHFFDLAPVWIYLLFAVALAAIEQRVLRSAAARALLAFVAAAVVLDFAPSRQKFSDGRPMAMLRRAGAILHSVPGEDGTLRIGLPLDGYSPLASWVAAQSSAGHAWGWVPWQSGRHWEELFAGALRPGAGTDAFLLEAARVRYFLPLGPALPAPWRVVGAESGLVLWQQSEALPVAQGYRSSVRLADAVEILPGVGKWPERAAFVSRALRANVLVVSPSPAGDEGGGQAAVLSLTDLAREPLPSAPPPVPAFARWIDPEHVAIDVDAGGAPAVVSVSEGHHPWWRARVDGEPAPVLRATLALMAVPVGSGAHRIELSFEPPASVAIADGVSAVAWIALLVGGPIGFLLHSRR